MLMSLFVVVFMTSAHVSFCPVATGPVKAWDSDHSVVDHSELRQRCDGNNMEGGEIDKRPGRSPKTLALAEHNVEPVS